MAKVINLKDIVPCYAECGCGHDLFLLRLHPDSTPEYRDIIALECAGCREVVPLEPTTVFECVLE